MTLVNANISEEILEDFRDVIYKKTGLKKGDFKEALEDAMLDFIVKYSKSEKTKELAKRAKKERG